MDLFNTEYTAQTAAIATGVDARKISDWATRGLIVGQKSGGGVQGSTRKYSFFNVMEIAVAATAIEQFNSTPSVAFELSHWFAHTGSGQFQPGDNSAPSRYPALPYHFRHGITYLIADGATAHIVLSKDGTVNLAAYPPHYSRNVGFQVLNLLEIFARVIQRLGGDYRKVLDRAHPDQA